MTEKPTKQPPVRIRVCQHCVRPTADAQKRRVNIPPGRYRCQRCGKDWIATPLVKLLG